MSCVNKASLQFKDCCKRLDLSEQQLEQIVYDYTNQLGNENTFPTDTYIEQLLRGIPTSELSDSQRELYKLKYEEAQPLDTFELAQQRVLELQQYYPDDRIRIIQRNNGKYQVVVNTDYSQNETELEIQQIKKEAIADGTFMKAPNGNPTNLTEKQWLQVRTKSFKDWFGDWENYPENSSRVVDENGEPLVVYHGTTEEFNTFDVEYIGSNPTSENKGENKIKGFFFTDSYNSGRTYGPIKAVFLNIRQPALQKQKYKSYDSVTGVNSDGSLAYSKEYYGVNTFRDLSKLKIRLYNDGIIAEGLDDALLHKTTSSYNTEQEKKEAEEFNESLYGNDYIVFNPNQIKSATDNVGTFSREDNNIYRQDSDKIAEESKRLSDFRKIRKVIVDKVSKNIDFETMNVDYHSRMRDANAVKNRIAESIRKILPDAKINVVVEDYGTYAHIDNITINDYPLLDEITKLERNAFIRKNSEIYNKYKTREQTISDLALEEQEDYFDFNEGSNINSFLQNTDAGLIGAIETIEESNNLENLYSKSGRKKYTYLNSKEASYFKSLIEKQGGFPKQFILTKKETSYSKSSENPLQFMGQNIFKKYIYQKANNNKRSLLYNIIDAGTGEVVTQKVRLIYDVQAATERIGNSIIDRSSGTKVYSDRRSVNFALYRQMPSEAKAKAIMKQYIYEAIKLTHSDNINLDAIVKLVDRFPNEIWKYVNVSLLDFGEYSEDINAQTSLRKNMVFQLSKLGLVQKVEQKYGLKLNGKNLRKWVWIKGQSSPIKTLDVSKLSRKQVQQALGDMLADAGVIHPTSVEENIKHYAEATGQSIKDIESFLYEEETDMFTSDLKDFIKNYNWQYYDLLESINKEYTESITSIIREKFADKYLNDNLSYLNYFFSGKFNWIDIAFNRTSVDETNADVYNRIAAILHEPMHALHAITYGTVEERALYDSFLQLQGTELGKTLIKQLALDNYKNNPETVYKEFVAYFTQLMLTPEALQLMPNLRSTEIAEFINAVKDAKYDGKEITVTTIEDAKLNFIQKLYNYIVEALHRIIPFTKNLVRLIDETKFSTKTIKIDSPETIKSKEFLSAIDDFQANIETLLQIDESSFDLNNVDKFFRNESYKQESIQTAATQYETVTEEFSIKQSVDEYVNDLIAIDNIKRENIKVEHFPETEDTDEYWIVSYTTQLPTEQSISQQLTLEGQQPLEEQPQEPSYEERQLAISEQVSNLINNDRGLKATELRQLSELMVYWMSEFISDCLDNPEKIFLILGITDYSNSDIEKVTLMSRKQIVQMIGVENMFNLCKSYVLTPDIDGTGKGNANINSRALRRQAELLKNNFQGLMQFSTSVWSTLEDFSIGLTETGYDTLETSNPDAFLDEELIKERDKQADGESTLESWQVESNTIDALTTATQLVKRELLHCYLYENTGEVDDLSKPIKRIKTNKFGINERLNPREAINAIIKWVLGCWDLNSMVAALKEHQDKNPWVEQLVNKLSDIKGNESDFQSQFFSCMCRSFQLYGVVNENDKKELYQHEINKNPMLLTAFNGIKDLYKVGEHPLLKLDGIDKKAFKEFREDIEQLINFSKKKYSEIENIDELNTLISHVYMLLGYYDATPEVVGAAMSDITFKGLVQNLLTLRTYLINEISNEYYNPFDFKANNSIISTLLNVLKPITYIMDDYAVTQFFESGNMRQSNVIPSFMTKLFSKMQLPLKKFEEFIEKEYGQFDWFYDKKLKKYKNEWLARLVRMSEEERKKLFEHKVQLSFNKKQYMRGMTDSEYAVSVISEYFTAGKNTAWYKVPIMSNKPASEFIKFYKYDDSDYKDRIIVGMQHIFVLELGRIQTIVKRQNAGINKSDPRFIKNFDKNGSKFCFLDFLNPFLNDKKTRLGQLLDIKISGSRELSTEENAELNKLVKLEVRNSMEARVQQIMESWRQQGILTAVSQIQGFEKKPEKAAANLESAANNAKIENFIWNDTFAAMEILQLTITDVAQYKDAEDLQKRLAQIHAPGVRGNIQARDYFGNEVSDGTHRAVYLTDFDDFISNVIDNVTKVFDKKIAEASENEKAQWKSLKESLVGENGAYRQINVADALAYACPTSYRKKAYMFGKWSREKERMYQLLMSGQYDFSTLKQAFGEPLKPFLYSYEEVDAGVENSPIETFKIGVQNKDSEYLLIMADALTRNENTGIPNILRAIYDVMEESHKVKNENGRYIAATNGIDDIQFESTVKAGLYGRINLKQFSTDSQGESKAKEELRSKIFDGLGSYNSTYIHETRYEDYCIQQEVPEHFKDHSQAHGSQIRYIIPSDLPLTNSSGETVVYSYFDPATGTERKLDAKQFKEEYEGHCAANIQESLDLLKEEFGLVTPEGLINFDRKQMNQVLSEILKREILSSPRYGIDMLLACSLNTDGEFNIPLGDPIQSKRIEQLINSIIKNRINKLKIAGGPVVLVTTFGTSRDLNIRFKDKRGGLLMTKSEFEKSGKNGSYEKYIDDYQDGIAYYEIYAPMYTNELFELFADENGNIDIKRIEKENPELLKIIGYRIPTEDKYSCFPAKIVGFLPREAGDAVMLPADITAITGSDFDVDKMYLMRKEFKVEKKSKEEITSELESKILKGLTGKAKETVLKQIEDFMKLKEGEKESAIKNNISNPIVKAYAQLSKKRFVEYTEGRQYHNNMIIDMSYSVLTNKEVAYQVLNPGGFELQKRMGYAIAAYKDPEVRSKYTFEQLMELPIEGDGTTLKSLCYKNKNLAFFDTLVQFYKQNSAAGMILGMFAVQKIAHAVLESDGFGIDLSRVFIDKNTNLQIPFSFCGIPFLGTIEIDKRFDLNNQLIGKTLGSLVASAADAVKDPVLNLNNINNQTANVLTTMLRLGITYEDAALLLSLPAISKILLEHSRRMVNKEFTSLNALIKARMLELDDKYLMSESEKIQSEPLDREDLIRGFSENDAIEAEKLEWKVLNAYSKFDQMSQIIKGLTNATRYNSVSNAVGPLIIDNLIMEYKAGKFSDAITYNGVEAKSINSVFNIHTILDKFSLATIIARRLLGEMPAYSPDFRILVNNSGDYTLSKIMGDRKLFSKLSDFYQSYLLVQSGFINPKDREYYTDKFPVEFMKYKEQYSDNPFVLAIRLSTGTFGGKTKGILTLDSVGMELMQKDKLSSGWADLYKENPELAKKLFIYNFFKGGLGFSPKTFMNLVPISMKESLENNGIKYVDVFRHLPSLGNYSMIFDLFVGNNIGDFKLLPQRNPYSEHLLMLGNKIIITNKFENYELDYFKVKGFNNIYRIFKLQLVDPVTKRKVFVEIPVLGNQGEFFGVSSTQISKSNVTNNNVLEEEGFEPSDEEIMSEEGYDPGYTKIAIDIIKQEKELKDTEEAYEVLKKSREAQKRLSEQEAEQRKLKIREVVMNSLKKQNVKFNEEDLDKTTNEFC